VNVCVCVCVAQSLVSISAAMTILADRSANLICGDRRLVHQTGLRPNKLKRVPFMKNLLRSRASSVIVSLLSLAGLASVAAAQDVFPFTDDGGEGNPGPGFGSDWEELPAVAPMYNITEIGTLGGNESYATAISDNGWIAGGSKIAPVANVSYTRAFRVRDGQALQNIGSLPGLLYSSAYGVNDAGDVVGSAANAANLYGSTAQPFIYRNGQWIDLDPINSGIHAQAAGISNSGWVIGTNSFRGVGSVEAFKWRSAAPINLPDFAGDICRISYGLGINDLGVAVGYSSRVGACGDARAVVYPASGGIVDLGTLGGDNSSAQSINIFGDIVGVAELATGQNRAAFWRNGTVTNLGTLGGASFALSVNNESTAVGYFLDNRNQQRSCVWIGGNPFDLNTLMANGSGWRLLIATGINNAGQIVGQGRNPAGQLRGFVLTPPCRSDYNRDGGVDGDDVGSYINSWSAGFVDTDVNWDGGVDGADVEFYMTLWVEGRC